MFNEEQNLIKSTFISFMPFVVKNNFTLHATICVSCIHTDNLVNWKIYNEQRKKTSKEYYIKFSYNASLPEYLNTIFDKLYYEQAIYFEVEV